MTLSQSADERAAVCLCVCVCARAAGVDTNNAAGTGAVLPAAASLIKYPMFMDENISSFFRRLSWSPDGACGRVQADHVR